MDKIVRINGATVNPESIGGITKPIFETEAFKSWLAQNEEKFLGEGEKKTVEIDIQIDVTRQ